LSDEQQFLPHFPPQQSAAILSFPQLSPQQDFAFLARLQDFASLPLQQDAFSLPSQQDAISLPSPAFISWAQQAWPSFMSAPVAFAQQEHCVFCLLCCGAGEVFSVEVWAQHVKVRASNNAVNLYLTEISFVKIRIKFQALSLLNSAIHIDFVESEAWAGSRLDAKDSAFVGRSFKLGADNARWNAASALSVRAGDNCYSTFWVEPRHLHCAG
jgi:hypothetical protein